MDKKWIKFPNGKVWLADAANSITGTVIVDNSSCIDLESLLSEVSQSATGSSTDLQDIAYQVLGGDMVSFTGRATSLLDDEEDRETIELAAESAELLELLQTQYGVNDACAAHMVACVGTEYGQEQVIQLVGSARELRCPAAGEELDYVRIVADGLEISYWSSDEWAEAPTEIIGALIGAMAKKA